MTVRGLELVRSAQVLIYDRLASPELVAEAPADAVLIDRDPLRQEEINELLVSYGSTGARVVRLKGGDPFVFGRGGEEALVLVEAGIPYEVVPGVSSISAVPASAGIPITHRGVSSQVTIVAAHDARTLDLEALARTPGTLVFFMGLGRLAAIADGLIANGKDAQTPAAVIANGTLPEQESVTAPLEEIASAAIGLKAPALVVVGEVVSLAGSLAVDELVELLAA
jgi:uroporphyrinogen III methyltransferase/synthase